MSEQTIKVSGHCGDCTYRDSGGYCVNAKLTEGGTRGTDMLVYDYQEGGGFWVGPLFGCIHFASAPRRTVDVQPGFKE